MWNEMPYSRLYRRLGERGYMPKRCERSQDMRTIWWYNKVQYCITQKTHVQCQTAGSLKTGSSRFKLSEWRAYIKKDILVRSLSKNRQHCEIKIDIEHDRPSY